MMSRLVRHTGMAGTAGTLVLAVTLPTSAASAQAQAQAEPQAPTQSIVATQRKVPRRTYATVSAPSAGMRNLKIVRYVGRPDDRVGTVIHERGRATAPHGSWGGVAPGKVGNFFVAGHRTSAGAPMYRVPNLKVGQKIAVRRGSVTYVYTVAARLWINFRSAKSRARQTAAVPGYPGRKATRPAIVLSTCATPEDRAAGLGWRDRYGNPTHRIAIVGYLSAVRRSVPNPSGSRG